MSIGFVMIVSPWSSWSEGRCRRRQCEGSAGEEEEECHCCWRVDHWRVTELTLFPFPDQIKVALGWHLFSDKEEAAATYLGMTESLYGHLSPQLDEGALERERVPQMRCCLSSWQRWLGFTLNGDPELDNSGLMLIDPSKKSRHRHLHQMAWISFACYHW